MRTESSRRDLAARWSTWLFLSAAVLAVTLLGDLASPALQRTLTEALVKLVVVVGLWVFVGNSGVVSFGHVGFMAIAGYVSAILSMPPVKKAALLDLPPALESLQMPVPLSVLVGTAAAGLVAWAIGLPLMRLKGVVASMATFAVLAIIHVVALNWQAVTGGRQALVGVVRVTDIWVAAGGAVLALLAASLYGQSRHGLLLRCSRENEVAAAASAIDVASERLIAFVLSAAIVGFGGALYVHFLGTVTASTFYLDLTFVTLAMLVVGGMRSLSGAVVGVGLVSTANEVLRSIEKGVDVFGVAVSAPPGLQEIGLALLLLAVLISRPQGLLGDYEVGWRPGRSTANAATSLNQPATSSR
ncbi:MAG: branched-chain amino acid ABC transporter permease [Geminicoccaceae bacterium]